ncbi:MAG: AsmA family protein [Elusimicrobia bacterium]|nr:AsmA family protein [Elusimicrobiota bacterium]
MPQERGRLSLVKIAAIVAAAGIAALAAAALTLKMLLPPDKIKSLVTEHAGRFLKREVRVRDVSVGLLKGLRIEGVEVSEHPDFKAGTFVSVQAFNLKIQLKPLLSKRVVIDRIVVDAPEATIVKKKDGSFNFSDLLLAPPAGGRAAGGRSAVSKASAAKSASASAAPAGLELPFLLAVKEAHVARGRIVYRDAGAGQEMAITSLEAKADDASLEKPFKASVGLSFNGKAAGRRLSGSAKAAARFDLTRLKQGAASADIEKAALDAAGLKANLSMKFALDPKQIALTEVSGTVVGGDLTASLKVRGYDAAPDVEVNAKLSAVDLEKLLAANEATQESASVARGARAAGGSKGTSPPPTDPAPSAGERRLRSPTPASASPPMSTRGSVTIGEAKHPFASAKDISLVWDLKGITPDLKSLGGSATLKVAGGHFSALDSLASRSKALKVLTLPFVTLQKIGKLGILGKFLPDFSTVTFSEIVGDYAFDRGLMTLRDCGMDSTVARVKATGTVNLPEEKLDVSVRSTVGKLAPIEFAVTGTFDEPKTKLKAESILAQPAVHKALEPAKRLLEGLFKKKK